MEKTNDPKYWLFEKMNKISELRLKNKTKQKKHK